MSTTDNQFDLPDDMKNDITLFQLVSSLAQQLEDRQLKRQEQINDLKMVNIPIMGPEDTPAILLKAMQTEILRQAEDLTLAANVIRGIEDRNLVYQRYLGVYRDEIDNLKAETKNLNDRLKNLEQK